ncbi:MAG TPA: EamA family transporter [Rhizomicrobium sp.]|nr:EamA family transporter [Rhizomicrobium sp.]
MKPALLATILGTVSLSAFAQVALKIGTAPLKSAAGKTTAEVILSVAASPFIWIGLGIYAASMLAWIWVLSKTDVSVAYPFVGISLVLTAVMGAMFLHENVSPLRIGGTLLVIFGCILIARSA